MLTDEKIEAVLEAVEAMLRMHNVEIAFDRSIKRVTQPGDIWETYAPGAGRRIAIEVPCALGEYYNDACKGAL